MPTRKIITQSTDGRFVGQEITIANGKATVGTFSFSIISLTESRIIGANYSITYNTQPQ